MFSQSMKKALTFARKCLIFSVGHLGLDCEADEDPETGPNNLGPPDYESQKVIFRDVILLIYLLIISTLQNEIYL